MTSLSARKAAVIIVLAAGFLIASTQLQLAQQPGQQPGPGLRRQPVNAGDVELSILAFSSAVTFSQTRAKNFHMRCLFPPRSARIRKTRSSLRFMGWAAIKTP
jgi:hypothetical protein